MEHPGRRHRHFPQRCQRPLRPKLLDKSKNSVEQHNGQDSRGIESVFQETGDDRRPDQHPDNDARELREKETQQERGLSFRQFVGTFSLEPLLSFVIG